MPIPQNKTDLIKAIKDNYVKFREELNTVPENIFRVKELEGHAKNTFMSVADLIAYLNGWGQLVLKWNKIKKNGEEPDFPETGYNWNQLGELANKFYKDYENCSRKELLNKLDKTVEEILDLVASKTNQQLYKVNWYKNYGLGRMIQLNTSSPYHNARLRIRKWKKVKGLLKIT